MWVIQKSLLLRLPDDVPLPPDSRVVDVPRDFDARDYRIEGGALVKADRETPEPVEKFTADEVRRLKAAIASDELVRKRRKEDR